MERSPSLARPSERRHWPPRLRPKRSASRVQERSLRALRRHDGPHRQRNHPLSLPHSDAASRTASRRDANSPRRSASVASKTQLGWSASRRSQRRRARQRKRAAASPGSSPPTRARSEEHTSELQSPDHLVCRLLLEKKNQTSERELRHQ